MSARTHLIALLCVLVVALVACQFTPEDRELVRSFVEDWARSKGVHPINEEGGLSISGLIGAGSRLLTGSTGDDEADAVLDAYEMLSNLNEADKLMDQGRKDRNPGAMDQAIERRPGDWTYRVSRAALALEQGDVETYEMEMGVAQSIRVENKIDGLWYLDETIEDLEDVSSRLAATGWPDTSQCARLNGDLKGYYMQRFALTGDQADLAAAQAASNMVSACQ